MPKHELVWDREAVRQYRELIERRTNKVAVRRCVEGHLLALSNNPEAAVPAKAPGDFRLHSFQCKDGETILYLRATVQVLPEDQVAILTLGTIEI